MWHPESIYDAGGHLDEGVVHAWLDGQLAPEAATQVEAHAAGCAPCSAMVAEARGLIAGASRVMASLDEPAMGQRPARDAMLGIVAAAGDTARAGTSRMQVGTQPGVVPPQRVRGGAPRWSIRRVSYAAAAAFVLVAGALVLRDSGSVREMVQADQQEFVKPDVEAAGDSTAGAPTAGAIAAAENHIASAPKAPSPVGAVEGAQAGVGAPAATGAASARRVVGGVGSASKEARNDAAADAGNDAPLAFRSPTASARTEPGSASARRQAATTSRPQAASPSRPPDESFTPPPAPAPARTAAPSRDRSRVLDEVVVTGVAGGRARSRDAGKAGDVVDSRDAATRAGDDRAMDARRQMQAAEAPSSLAAANEARAGTVRSSAEIQAMVSMVSRCWRVAETDSVVELLPPGSPSTGASAAPALWIPGWLRVGRDDTNPDRIWWVPLADSVSARVRLGTGATQDLVITPRPASVELRRVARTDSLATWQAIPRGGSPESAASVRCMFP